MEKLGTQFASKSVKVNEKQYMKSDGKQNKNFKVSV